MSSNTVYLTDSEALAEAAGCLGTSLPQLSLCRMIIGYDLTRDGVRIRGENRSRDGGGFRRR